MKKAAEHRMKFYDRLPRALRDIAKDDYLAAIARTPKGWVIFLENGERWGWHEARKVLVRL